MVHLTGTHTEVVVIVVSVVDSRGCDGSVMFTSWVERLPEKTKKKENQKNLNQQQMFQKYSLVNFNIFD